MTPTAKTLVRVFILDGILATLKEMDRHLTAALLMQGLIDSDETRRQLMESLNELEEKAPVLMEIMVEESMHDHIRAYQKTLDVIPGIKYAILDTIRQRTPEEEIMHTALSPIT